MDEYVSVIGESFTNLDDAVKVILRIRPPLEEEKENINLFEIVSPQQLNVKIPSESWTYKNVKRLNTESSYNFEFSNIFDWNAGQEKVFAGVINSVVLDFLSGRNSLLFTYGITNSGKTYTLIGKPQDAGILPRTLDYLFSCIGKYNIATKPLYKPAPHKGVVENEAKQMTEDEYFKQQLLTNHSRVIHEFCMENTNNGSFECDEINQETVDNINLGLEILDIPDGINTTFYVYMSIAEIYNEYIYDLLDPSLNTEKKERKRSTLKVVGDQKTGFYVKNLRNVIICNALEAVKFLQIGLYHRRMAATKMNINSSRSHVVYSIRLVRSNELPNGQIATKSNEICFVDLAGAERQKSTFNEGSKLREASNINKSLLFLGRCIEEMKQYRLNLNKNIVVSYRESKLTRLLQPFFVGRASMILLVNISPSISVFDDTINVLKFSALTKEALSRPLGTELQQAARTDAMLNDSECIDLSDCTNSELIEIIHTMRRKILDSIKNSDAQNSIIREEMSQFTMKMMQELEEEKERQIILERKLISETYLVKIDLLIEEINHLRANGADADSTNKNDEIIENLKANNNELCLEVSKKEELIKQLISDVEQYKMDSRDEIAAFEKSNRELSKQLDLKVKELDVVLNQYEDLKNQILMDQDLREGEQSRVNLAQLEYQKSFKDLENRQQYLNDALNRISMIAGNGFDNVSSDMKDLLNDIIPLKDTIFNIKNNLNSAVVSVVKTVSEIQAYQNASNKHEKALTTKISELSSLNDLNWLLFKMFQQISTDYHQLNSEIKDKIEDSNRVNDIAITDLRDMISTYSRKANDKIKGLSQTCANLQKYEQEYKAKIKECQDIQDKYKELEYKNLTLAEELKIIHQSNQTNLEKYNEIKRKFATTEENLFFLKAKVHDSQLDTENRQPLTEKQIYSYENEIKSYKRLNDEYLQNISKLEQMLSDRNQLDLSKSHTLKRTTNLNTDGGADIKKSKT